MPTETCANACRKLTRFLTPLPPRLPLDGAIAFHLAEVVPCLGCWCKQHNYNRYTGNSAKQQCCPDLLGSRLD